MRRPVSDQSFSLKESQNPLLTLEPPADPNACLRKAREAFTRYTPQNRTLLLHVRELLCKEAL